MSIDDLVLPDKAKKFFIEHWGITKLHPPQAKSMEAVFSNRSALIAIPTASGKSLIAYIAILRKLLLEDIGSKAIYIVPLKALASEKFEDFKALGKALNLTIAVSYTHLTLPTNREV